MTQRTNRKWSSYRKHWLIYTWMQYPHRMLWTVGTSLFMVKHILHVHIQDNNIRGWTGCLFLVTSVLQRFYLPCNYTLSIYSVSHSSERMKRTSFVVSLTVICTSIFLIPLTSLVIIDTNDRIETVDVTCVRAGRISVRQYVYMDHDELKNNEEISTGL